MPLIIHKHVKPKVRRGRVSFLVFQKQFQTLHEINEIVPIGKRYKYVGLGTNGLIVGYSQCGMRNLPMCFFQHFNERRIGGKRKGCIFVHKAKTTFRF